MAVQQNGPARRGPTCRSAAGRWWSCRRHWGPAGQRPHRGRRVRLTSSMTRRPAKDFTRCCAESMPRSSDPRNNTAFARSQIGPPCVWRLAAILERGSQIVQAGPGRWPVLANIPPAEDMRLWLAMPCKGRGDGLRPAAESWFGRPTPRDFREARLWRKNSGYARSNPRWPRGYG